MDDLLPMGSSSRSRAPARRKTSKEEPSGLQSALITLSMTSRGAPPANGTRASVRPGRPGRFTPMASSPEPETEPSNASLRSSERDSGPPGWVEKISGGPPSHRAS